MRKQNGYAKTRNVVLKIRTHNRLERYKVELIRRRENPGVTYDDVINDLLNGKLGINLDKPIKGSNSK